MFSKSLSLAFLAGVSLVSLAAFADGTIVPTPTPTTSPSCDDVEFRCRFEGGATGKDGSWFERCRAEGKIDVSRDNDLKWIFGDHDDFLRVRCENGDDMDDGHGHDGSDHRNDGVIYGLTRGLAGDDDHRFDTLITGDRTVSPLIRVVGFDFHSLHDDHHDGEHHDHDRRGAFLTEWRHGMSFTIPGFCEFRRKDNSPTPVPVH